MSNDKNLTIAKYLKAGHRKLEQIFERPQGVSSLLRPKDAVEHPSSYRNSQLEVTWARRGKEDTQRKDAKAQRELLHFPSFAP